MKKDAKGSAPCIFFHNTDIAVICADGWSA